MTRLAVIDHGAGNLVSISRALEHVGASVATVETATDLSPYDGVVLPGVGATGAVMRNMQRRDLVDPVRRYDGPLLGICVGMQVLFDHSDENDNPCLGLLRGNVRRLEAETLPHMGWNDVTGDDPILGGRSRAFYFVHSYAVDPDGIDIVTGSSSVEGDRFPSIVRSGRILGVQFHPERSGADGLEVLRRFTSEAGGQSRAA